MINWETIQVTSIYHNSSANEIRKTFTNANIEFYKVDVSNPTEVEDTWNKIITKYNKVNILINNAAIARG